MRVAVAGASGKMGGRLVHLIKESSDFELMGGLERHGHPAIGRDLGEVIGLGTLGVPLVDDLKALAPKIDLLFEFTAPEASLEHLRVMADHGKSMVLSTHLLGDVERVCETVVILHQGQVLRQGQVAELRTRRQDRYRLQIQGNPSAFVDELRLEGARVMDDNGRGELRVAVPPGWPTRAFFALADNHGVLVRGLQHDDEELEELFHRVITENGRNDNA